MRSTASTGGRVGAPAGPAELLGAAGSGDDDAWAELVRRYGRLVWSVLAGSGLDPASAADAYQTVWLRLCEHVHRIQDPDALASWLATTARREAARLRRDRARVVPVDEPPEIADRAAVLPGDRLVEEELRADVRAALACIDEPSRRTLMLLCAESRPGYHRIAELTGRPLGSIGPTRARALQKIRRHLSPP
jgi:RNA polymerase sigma factor (sigma-70 family)